MMKRKFIEIDRRLTHNMAILNRQLDKGYKADTPSNSLVLRKGSERVTYTFHNGLLERVMA